MPPSTATQNRQTTPRTSDEHQLVPFPAVSDSEGLSQKQRKNKTRLDFIRAAVAEFGKRGYNATTIDDIVNAAPYSRRTFFRYFPTKEDVVFGDVPERIASIPVMLSELGPQVDPWRAVRDAITGLTADLIVLIKDLEPQCVNLWYSEPAVNRRYSEITISAEETVGRFLASSWDTDFEASVECQVMAAALVGVARAAIRAQVSSGVPLSKALSKGMELLEHGMPGRYATNGTKESSVTNGPRPQGT